MRDVRGVLWAALVATVGLPIVFGVAIGLGLLLEALGDDLGWQWCRRLAMLVGAAWAVAVVATTVCSAVLSLAGLPGPPASRRPRDDDGQPG